MIVIDNEFCVADKLSENVIKLEARPGVNVCQETAEKTVYSIVDIMGGEFGILINRVNDYSVDPTSIYSFLNTIPTLKAFAIVVHRPSYMNMILMQQNLFNRPLEGFLTLDDAYDWLRNKLDEVRGT